MAVSSPTTRSAAPSHTDDARRALLYPAHRRPRARFAHLDAYSDLKSSPILIRQGDSGRENPLEADSNAPPAKAHPAGGRPRQLSGALSAQNRHSKVAPSSGMNAMVLDAAAKVMMMDKAAAEENEGVAGGTRIPSVSKSPSGNVVIPEGTLPETSDSRRWQNVRLNIKDLATGDDGRPWYDSMYVEGVSRSPLRNFARRVTLWTFVIFPHYAFFWPTKAIAVAVFYIFFPHLIIEMLDQKGRAKRRALVEPRGGLGGIVDLGPEEGGSNLWLLYKMMAGVLLMPLWTIYASIIVVPLCNWLSRPEATTDLVRAYFQAHLDWGQGWSLPVRQLQLSMERRPGVVGSLVPVTRFDDQNRAIGKAFVLCHEVNSGLDLLPDMNYADRTVNQMLLWGHDWDTYVKSPYPVWSRFASRFLYFCSVRKRCKWSPSRIGDALMFIVNSPGVSIMSVRFAHKMHPLSRNERTVIVVQRMCLNLVLTTFWVNFLPDPDNPGERYKMDETSRKDQILKGIVTFVVIVTNTLIARASGHVGRAPACADKGEQCGKCGKSCLGCSKCCTPQGLDVEHTVESAVNTYLMICFIGLLIAAGISLAVLFFGQPAYLSDYEARSNLVDPAEAREETANLRRQLGIDFIVSNAISEIVAWLYGTAAYCWWALLEWYFCTKAVREIFTELPEELRGYNEFTTTLLYLKQFMESVQWPSHLVGAPGNHTPEELLQRIDPWMGAEAEKNGGVIGPGTWCGLGPSPQQTGFDWGFKRYREQRDQARRAALMGQNKAGVSGSGSQEVA